MINNLKISNMYLHDGIELSEEEYNRLKRIEKVVSEMDFDDKKKLYQTNNPSPEKDL